MKGGEEDVRERRSGGRDPQKRARQTKALVRPSERAKPCVVEYITGDFLRRTFTVDRTVVACYLNKEITADMTEMMKDNAAIQVLIRV